jgi:hypothetical protein
MPDHERNPLDRWQPPPTPRGLKNSAVSAALDADRRPEPRRIEDRLWESRPLRYGWIAAASMLLALNLVVENPQRPQNRHAAVAEASAADEYDVGVEVPSAAPRTWTVAEARALVGAMLEDSCFEPMAEGDCT